MLRIAAIILVSVIHFTISQTAFSQYAEYVPELPNVDMEEPPRSLMPGRSKVSRIPRRPDRKFRSTGSVSDRSLRYENRRDI